jgi:hypothetical protein
MNLTAAVEKVIRRIAPDVGERLEKAKARLAALEAEHGRLALAATLNETGATGKLATWEKQVSAAKSEIGQLEAAHEVAQLRDRADEARRDVAVRREQYTKLEKHAAARVKAAKKMSAGLALFAEGYSEFLPHTGAMVDGLPSGCEWPPAWAHHLSRAEPAICNEMWRHSAVKQIGERGVALPGAKPLNEINRYQPEMIRPLAETVAESNEYLLSAIRSQIETAEQIAAEMRDAA